MEHLRIYDEKIRFMFSKEYRNIFVFAEYFGTKAIWINLHLTI